MPLAPLAQHDLLGEQLRGPVDARGLDGLVGRDQHEALDAGLQRGVDDVARAEHVVLDRLDGVSLQHRHVLVRRGVEDHGRAGAPEDEGHVLPVLDLPEDRHDRRPLADAFLLQQAQLALDLVEAVLAVAEEVQALGAALQQLAAELRADAAAGAGHEHAPAPHVGEALLQIDLHRAAGEEVLGVDLAGLDQVRRAVEHLREPRHEPDAGEPRPAQHGPDAGQLLPRRAGDRDDGLVGGVDLHEVGHRVDGAEDRDSLHAPPDLRGVVVEERRHPAEDPLPADLPGQRRTGEPGAHDINVAAFARHFLECRRPGRGS